MKLRILHRTEYRYAQPVTANANELRLTPRTDRYQAPSLHLVRVLPVVRMRRYSDLHRNTVHRFEIEEPHREMAVDVTTLVETRAPDVAGLPRDVPLSAARTDELVEAFQPYLLADGAVAITPGIWRRAVDIESEGGDCLTTLLAVCGHVHASCRYVPGATQVGTTTAEFEAHPEGVCQDYAHFMVALCRAISLPARYVCGYVYDPRREVLGSHSTHAWCEAWLPGHGWLGLDPTNNRVADDSYVVAAVGRDYRDAAPVSGTYFGTGEREMRVTVHVEGG